MGVPLDLEVRYADPFPREEVPERWKMNEVLRGTREANLSRRGPSQAIGPLLHHQPRAKGGSAPLSAAPDLDQEVGLGPEDQVP